MGSRGHGRCRCSSMRERQGGVAEGTAALFSFLWQKRKQGSWKAKQAQIGGREVQTADNETCATFRRHSRRQEHDKVCSKISKMCGKKQGAKKRFPKPHGFISDGAREKSRASASSSEGRAGT